VISTTCKDCVFKEMHGKVQTGCSLGILDRFEEAGAEITLHCDEGVAYKKVDRVCMYRRPDWDWNSNIYDEVFIRSTIVVLHSSGDDLKETLKSVAALDTPKPPNVVVGHTTDNLSEIYKTGTSIISPKRFSCVYMVESTYDGATQDEAFKRCKNGWIFFVKSGTVLDKDTLKVLNHSVNYTMNNNLATTGIECYMALAYKVLHGHRGLMLETLSQIPKAVIGWDKLNEDYRLYIERQSTEIKPIRRRSGKTD